MAEATLEQVLQLIQGLAQEIKILKEKPTESPPQKRFKKEQFQNLTDDDLEALMGVREENTKLQKQFNDYLDQQANDRLVSKAQEHLLEFGVDPKKLPFALSYLKDKMKITKDNKMTILSSAGAQVDLSAGLKEFCSSDQGEFFKPVVPLAGGGTDAKKDQRQTGTTIKDPDLESKDPLVVQRARTKAFDNMIAKSMGIKAS